MKKLVIGNWKMNPETLDEAKKIFSQIKNIAKKFQKVDVVICPPAIFLSDFSKKLSGSNVNLGAQDVFWDNPRTGSRAFTGEISAEMLANIGAKYVILGHSERRVLGETDKQVNQKIKIVLEAGLKPVICIGEKERDLQGDFFETLRLQMKGTLDRLKKPDLQKIIIAYEPVWAIGKKDSESIKGEDLYQMTIFIKKILTEMFGKTEAFKVTIIYGGSVSPFNVKDFFTQGHVSGILPGRASLDSKVLKEILEMLETL